MKHIARVGTLAMLLAGLSATGALADTELVLSSWLPPRHPIVVNAIRPWAEEVDRVTEGRVTVRVLGKPLGRPEAHFDMARDGIADVTYGLHSFTDDDRFTNSQVGQFSFIGDDAVKSAEAFWTVYTADLDARKEHAGVRLLGLFVHGPGLLHTSARKIETLEDFAGLKIRVPGGHIASLMSALGSTTLFMSSPEVYERLSRGVIDGVAFTYEALTAFNLTDDIESSMMVPGGLYNTTWFLVANEAKWNEISPEDQKAIEEISGLAFAGQVGKAWNDADQAAVEEIDAAGIEVYQAPPPVLAVIEEQASRLEDEWAASIDDEYDGKAALARLREMSGVEVPSTGQ